MDEIMFGGGGKRSRKRGSSLPTAANEAQPSLFGDDAKPANHVGPATRTGDPETSHRAEATARKNLSLKQLAVLDAFQLRRKDGVHRTALGMIDETLVAHYQGHTLHRISDERGWWPEQTDSGLRTRRSELVTLGYLADSKRKADTEAGGRSIIWQLTPDGEAFPVRGHLERLRMLERQTRMVRGMKPPREDHL